MPNPKPQPLPPNTLLPHTCLAGTITPKDDGTLKVHFQHFWLDMGAASLRPELQEGADGKMGQRVDQTIAAIG